MKKAVLALMLATSFASPALADPPPWSSGHARVERGDRDHHDGRDWRDHRRDNDRRDWDNRRADNRRDWDRRIENRRDWERRQDWRRDARRDHRWDRDDWRRWNRYDYNRPDPRYGRYYADRYYRDGSYYGYRNMGRYDRIYRGYDGRYYCRRSDGTTGLILGAIGGGLLGDAIAPGDSRTIGALLGGTLGALLGREIDRDGVRCR